MSAACCARRSCRPPARPWKAGTLPLDALRAVEDRCIAAAIAKQEAIGLRAATDGEYRRAYWHYDFVAGLDGVELYEPEQKIQFKGGVPLAHMLRVNGRIGWSQAGDDRRLPVRRQPRADGGAEADHPLAVAWCISAAAARRSITTGLSGPGRVLRRSGRGLPQGGARRSARPAAAICSSTRSTSPICATPNRSPALKARGEHVEDLLGIYARHAQPRDRGQAGRHDDLHASVPRQFPLHLGRVGRL